MSISPEGVPHTLLNHFKHNEALHERIVLLSILAAESPFVAPKDRVTIEDMGQGFHRVIARYGYMESPHVPKVLKLATEKGLPVDVYSASFFLGRETLLTTGDAPMARWRKVLFAFMSRNAWNATSFFNIPPERVVELGTQVEL
jgi:KUP system potassium uptake protein